MIRRFSADIVFPVSQAPIPEGVVVTNEHGTILETGTRDQYDPAELDIRQGAIGPGFVNTHCHLELSHMKGRIPPGSGLLGFIGNVVKNRTADAELIRDCIRQAEQEMIDGGIVAVGDISNTTDTFEQKQLGKLRYYTFVEFFDLFQDANAQGTFDHYSAVYDALPAAPHLKKSKVPHAPYSVSRSLFRLLNDWQPAETISVHNQETPPENELFLSKTGGFIEFYKNFGLSTDSIPLLQQPSIHYVLEYLSPRQIALFVHNTLSGAEDIRAAQEKLGAENCYWATCPNANLYIENRLPDYRTFLDSGARMTIGTDSLTSNWQLSILEEMKVIQAHFPEIGFETLLSWATRNGAMALGWGDQLGSLEPGKTPGLVLIQGLSHGSLTPQTSSKRLI